MAHQILTPKKKTMCKKDGHDHKQRPRYDRGRPQSSVMDEIGYENCDFISDEIEWKFWLNLIEESQFKQRNLTLELHVPCREPIDHLMSIANHFKRKFKCVDMNDEKKLVKKVMDVYATKFDERINDKFLEKVYYSNKTDIDSRLHLKCFHNYPIESYINYMGQFLRPRRIPVEEYWPRDTNKPRDKTKECIWSQTSEYKQKVLEILLDKVPYFKFCQSCMGSKDELQLSP